MATRPDYLLLIAGLVLWLTCVPHAAQGDIVKYVDADGTIHFTNMPTQANYQRVSYAIKETRQNVKIAPEKPFWFSFGRLGYFGSGGKNNIAYDRHIADACLQYGLDQRLVKAVIKAESAFDPFAVSPKGAQGLMQLMPSTSRDMGVLNPFDPQENIHGGVRYLRLLLDRFNNNVVNALAAYNAGPESVQKYGGIPPYLVTQTYVQRVLSLYSLYSR
jgi:hypothetical protein